jgi:hypothetical protein
MPDTIDAILSEINRKGDPYTIGVMYTHRPIIKHGGDQRDPTEEITCACKQSAGFVPGSLDQPYFLHLYGVVSTLIATAKADTGR